MNAGTHSKIAKQVENIVGKHALTFLPFNVGRTSEAVFNAYILCVVGQEGPCWPYRIIKLFREQWRRDATKLAAIGLMEPSNLGIQRRIEDLEKDGFLRAVTPQELEKMPNISHRVKSKVYDLSRKGFALAWLLNPIRNDDEAIKRLLKRTDVDGDHQIPGARVLWKLMERRRKSPLLKHIFTKASYKLLSEVEEDETELGLSDKDLVEDEEIRLFQRFGQHLLQELFDFVVRGEALPQSKRMRYLQAIGPPKELLEECEEVRRMIKEDPDIRASVLFYKQLVLDATEKLGL